MAKVKKEKVVTHRIPYDHWINSQLSVARFYGGCKLNGKDYIFDPKCVYDADGKGKPDLITYN